MDKIEKIKEWVNEQKKEELARNSIGVITGKALFVDANELLSFLDTLMEESDKSLEEAAEEYIKKGRYLPEAWVVRPAFVAGAEWQKEQDDKETADLLTIAHLQGMEQMKRQLLQGSPMPEDTVLFNKGVAEGRRLEREDSVECEVTDVGFNYLDLALFDAESLELKSGDKVKVIVIKAGEE